MTDVDRTQPRFDFFNLEQLYEGDACVINMKGKLVYGRVTARLSESEDFEGRCSIYEIETPHGTTIKTGASYVWAATEADVIELERFDREAGAETETGVERS